MNVLSIDFDYFQVTTPELLMRYPDCGDLTTKMSTIAWASVYADDVDDDFADITINQNELDSAVKLILEQDENCPVLVTNSHVHIYQFILDEMKKNNSDDLFITHIDMHSDYYNNPGDSEGNNELDCGNWLCFLEEKYKDKLSVEWVVNPVSLDCFWDEHDEGIFKIKDSIAQVQGTHYDAIFLCRSDNWLPPHLDMDFDYLLSVISDHFTNVKVQECVTEYRDYEKMEEEMVKARVEFNKMQEELKKSKDNI